VLFQQGGAPPLFRYEVRSFLHWQFPGKWICRGRSIILPSCSPDLTPLILRGWYFKYAVYILPLATTLLGLAEWIRAAVTSFTRSLFNKVWAELEYKHDIFHATKVPTLNIFKIVSTKTVTCNILNSKFSFLCLMKKKKLAWASHLVFLS